MLSYTLSWAGRVHEGTTHVIGLHNHVQTLAGYVQDGPAAVPRLLGNGGLKTHYLAALGARP
jgi:hypothetical protein